MVKNTLAAIGVVAMLGATSVTVLAVGQDDDQQRSGKRLERMVGKLTTKLDLDQQQQASLEALLAEARPLMKETRAQKKEARRAFMNFDDFGADYETALIRFADEQAEATRSLVMQAGSLKMKVAQILTPDQLLQLQALVDENGGRLFAKRGHRKHRKNQGE